MHEIMQSADNVPFQAEQEQADLRFSPNIDFRNRYIIMRLFVTYMNMSFIVFNIFARNNSISLFQLQFKKKFCYRQFLKARGFMIERNGNWIEIETFDKGTYREVQFLQLTVMQGRKYNFYYRRQRSKREYFDVKNKRFMSQK